MAIQQITTLKNVDLKSFEKYFLYYALDEFKIINQYILDRCETSKQDFLMLQNKYNYQKNINSDLLISLEQLESKCDVLQKQKSHIDKMHLHNIASLNKQVKEYQEKIKLLETPTKPDIHTTKKTNSCDDHLISPPTTPVQSKLKVPPPPPPPMFCSPQAPPLPFKFKSDQPTKKIPISKASFN